MDLTPEALQNISVKVVSSFMLKQASLCDAIAGEAKSLELNPDQIKRVIESSNTVAYLRQLEDASNRSDLEFPVATYENVMSSMVVPTITKSAENQNKPVQTNPLDAQAPETQINSSITEQEKQAMLVKETLRIKSTLVKMAEDGYVTASNLEKAASQFAKDPLAFEKLAKVVAPTDLRQIVTLCKLDLTKEASEGSVFTDKDLSSAVSLNILFKEARDMVLDFKKKEEFVKKASEQILEKIASGQYANGGFWKKTDKVTGPVIEGVGNAIGKTINVASKGVLATANAVGRGISKLTAGKTFKQRAINGMDAGFGVLGSQDIQHDQPVWQSIHG